MDPSVVVGTGLAVLGSKDILNRLLGPTADYVGGEVRSFVEKCNINLDAIFASAVRRSGTTLDHPGGIAPRVLKEVMTEGRFCEDELTAEYYGGLLASSRTPNGNDDTLLPYLAVLRELSTHQIRLHYLVYSAIYNHFHRDRSLTQPNVDRVNDCHNCRLSVPGVEMLRSISHGLPETKTDVFERVHRGLEHRRLLVVAEFARPIVYEPTPAGADLFMMANGKRGHLSELFEYDLMLPQISFPLLGDAQVTYEEKSETR